MRQYSAAFILLFLISNFVSCGGWEFCVGDCVKSYEEQYAPHKIPVAHSVEEIPYLMELLTLATFDKAIAINDIYWSAKAVGLDTNNTPSLFIGGQSLYRFFHNGNSWTAETIVTPDESGQETDPYLNFAVNYPMVVSDPDGFFHVSFYDRGAQSLVYVNNVSGEWDWVTVDQFGDVGWRASIALDQDRNIHLAYFSENNGEYEVRYATNIGGEWSISPLDFSEISFDAASIATDSQNKAHISYFKNGQVWYSTNQNGDWGYQNLGKVTTKALVNHSNIAVDETGAIHLTYINAPLSEPSRLEYLTNTAGIWETGTIDTVTGFGIFWYHSLYQDTQNKLHLSYVNENGQLSYATNRSGSWTAVPINFAVGNETGNSLIIDAGGAAHIFTSSLFSDTLYYLTNLSGSWQTSSFNSVYTGESLNFIGISDGTVSIYNSQTIYRLDSTEGNVTEEHDGFLDIFDYSIATEISLDSQGGYHFLHNAESDFYESNNERPTELSYTTNISGDWQSTRIASGSVITAIAMTIDANQKAHISYSDGTWLYYLTNVTDEWVTWPMVSDRNSITGSVIRLDSEAAIHVAYTANNRLKYTTNQSGTFTQAVVDTQVDYPVCLTLDEFNNAHIGYFTDIDVPAPSDGEPYQQYYYVAYANNVSGQWQKQGIKRLSEFAYQCNLHLDSSQGIHLVFDTGSKIRYIRKVATTWEVSTLYQGSVTYSSTFDSRNQPHISLYDSSRDRLIYLSPEVEAN